jgi:predicted enzyme related to lactoylglutathione lyase
MSGGLTMRIDGQIDFVEFPGQNQLQMRHFYGEAFGWKFADCGDDYVVFEGSGARGVIFGHPSHSPLEPMAVFYVRDLEAVREKVLAVGGEITRDIFAIPGGRRFHFRDPGENEAAVWSDQLKEPEPERKAVAVRNPPPLFAFWEWGHVSRQGALAA